VVGAIRDVSRSVVSVRIESGRMVDVSVEDGMVVVGGGGVSRDSGRGEHATRLVTLRRSRVRDVMMISSK